MTFSEYSRIMEIEEAKADNVMADIDYMIESANATHKLNLADLDFKFESEDYDMALNLRLPLTHSQSQLSRRLRLPVEKLLRSRNNEEIY